MALECYFSHSWAAGDVPLNVLVWDTVSADCVLYVDRQGAEAGTYYINRLEELIRKSDVFISVLAYREPGASEGGRPDYKVACSPGSLFEVRLAERARKPRWIVYDDRTNFVPQESGSDLVVYTPVDAIEEVTRGGPTVKAAGARWMERVRKDVDLGTATRSRRAALLIDDAADDAATIGSALERTVKQAGYKQVTRIEPFHTDAEAVEILQVSGLLVAEVGAPSVRDMYGMAHALFIPTVRFVRTPLSGDVPRLLDGHPGGYQHDLLLAENIDGLATEVGKRAAAMRDNREPIESRKAGCAYLRRRLYRPHQVLFSHNLSREDGSVLTATFEQLESLGIRAWEYRHNNKAGVVWKDELDAVLTNATDIVFIFGDEFELSEACAKELKAITGRRADLKSVTPYLWGDRVKPNPDFSTIHHEPLPRDAARAAKLIVESLVKTLQPPPTA